MSSDDPKPHVWSHIEGGVGEIVIDRPDAMNALSPSMVDGLIAITRRFEADARIETEGFPDDVGVYTMIQLAFAPSGGITISRGEKGTYLDVMDLNVANGQTSKLSTQSVRVGKWVELTLYVTLPTSASEEGYAELLVDGISGARLPITFAATKGRPIALGLGMVAQGPTNDVELAFDNVRIEIQK